MNRRVRGLLGIGWVGLLVFGGCATGDQPSKSRTYFYNPFASQATMTKDSEEHYRQVAQSAHRDSRAIIEDLDLLFMTERSSRLNRWHDQ